MTAPQSPSALPPPPSSSSGLRDRKKDEGGAAAATVGSAENEAEEGEGGEIDDGSLEWAELLLANGQVGR